MLRNVSMALYVVKAAHGVFADVGQVSIKTLDEGMPMPFDATARYLGETSMSFEAVEV